MKKSLLYIGLMVFIVFLVSLFLNNATATPTGNYLALPNSFNQNIPDDLVQQEGVVFEGVEYKNFCLIDKYPEYRQTASKHFLKKFVIANDEVKGSWFNCATLRKTCSQGKCVGSMLKNTEPYNPAFQVDYRNKVE